MPFYLSALAAAVVVAAATPPARTNGVLVTGRDVPPAPIASAQAQIETRLMAGGLVVRGAIDLGAAIGSTAPPLDARARAEAGAKIEAARAAHYAGSPAAAIAALAEAAEIHDKAPGIPVEDRVTAGLWRVTVLLAAGDTAGAELAARDVARIAPRLDVPLSTFSPPVKALVDSQRALVVASTPITFTGAPGLEVLFDDAPVAGRRVVTSPGRHWIRTRAAGVVENAWAISVGAEPLAVALRPPVVSLTPEILAKLGATDGPGAVAREARVDALAIVLLTPEGIRTRAWNGRETLSGAFGPDELDAATRWVLESLAPPRIARVAPTPTPVPRRPHANTTTASAGPVIAFATRSVSASGFDPVTLDLTGTGAAVDVRHARGTLRAGAEMRAVSFAPTQTTAVIGDVRARAPGGTLASARVTGGVAFAGELVVVSAGLFAERYQATALPIDQRVPLFVSQTRIAPELRVGSRIELDPVVLRAEIGLAPMTVVSENPNGTTGRSPRGGPDLDWRLSTSLPMGRTWRGTAMVDGASRRVAYDGAASAAFDPPLRNATVAESFVAVTVAFERAF